MSRPRAGGAETVRYSFLRSAVPRVNLTPIFSFGVISDWFLRNLEPGRLHSLAVEKDGVTRRKRSGFLRISPFWCPSESHFIRVSARDRRSVVRCQPDSDFSFGIIFDWFLRNLEPGRLHSLAVEKDGVTRRKRSGFCGSHLSGVRLKVTSFESVPGTGDP